MPRGGCCASSASPSARCAPCSSSCAGNASAGPRRHRRRSPRTGGAGTNAPPPRPPAPAPGRVEHRRQALDRLARRWAQLRRELDPDYAWPQAQARVNRAMGVRRRADAREAELDAGLAFLRAELTKLTRDYPEQAERLRIPGSVEGIDQRLGLATEGDR